MRFYNMKIKFLIFLCCLCLIGCKKTQFQNNETRAVDSKVSNTLDEQDKTTDNKSPESENRTVTSFLDSLTDEEYINAYKDLVLFLWDKNDFIEKNYDTIDKTSKKYKSNESHALNTTFVNNELLTDAPLKIGMTKDEVYKYLGHPERSMVEEKTEVVDYYYSLFVLNHNEPDAKFYASTSVEFIFDENAKITKIILVVEWIEEPVDDSYWLLEE